APDQPAQAGAPVEALLAVEARTGRVRRDARAALEQYGAPRTQDPRPLQRREVGEVGRAALARERVLDRVAQRGRGARAELAVEAHGDARALAVDQPRGGEVGAEIAGLRVQRRPRAGGGGQPERGAQRARLHHRQQHALLAQQGREVAVARLVRSEGLEAGARGQSPGRVETERAVGPVGLLLVREARGAQAGAGAQRAAAALEDARDAGAGAQGGAAGSAAAERVAVAVPAPPGAQLVLPRP